MINIFQPTVGDEELAAVRDVLTSGWLGRGSRTQAFERDFARHLGVDEAHVTSVNSCTEALFVAMELLGVGPGSEVILPTVSFVGAANAVAAQGAQPVFCDVDPRTLNPTVQHVASRASPRTRAVVLLHYGGLPGSVRDIAEWCRQRGIALVEDAACAVASRVDGRPCGTFGDVGAWSFDPMKVVVAGDGGMLYARDPELVSRARRHTYLGLEQGSGLAQAATSATRWWEFDISSFGRRSIMNDIAGAIGQAQLRKLEAHIRRRKAIAARYDQELADVPGLLPPPQPPRGHESSYYLYWVQMDARIRDTVARSLYEKGIYTTFRYALLHRIQRYGDPVALPNAEHAAERTLCLPLHQGLDDADVGQVVSALRSEVDRCLADSPAARAGSASDR